MRWSSRLGVIATACCLVVVAANCDDETSSTVATTEVTMIATSSIPRVQTPPLPDGAPEGLPRNCGSIQDRNPPESLAEMVDNARLVIVATSSGMNRPLEVPPGSSVQVQGLLVDEYDVTQSLKGVAPKRIEVIGNFFAYDYVNEVEIPTVTAQWEYLFFLKPWGRGIASEYLAHGLFIRARGSGDDRFFAYDCHPLAVSAITVADVTAAVDALPTPTPRRPITLSPPLSSRPVI